MKPDSDTWTMADYAEAWHVARGLPVPTLRDSDEWREMYAHWVECAWEGFPTSLEPSELARARKAMRRIKKEQKEAQE